MFLTNEGWTEAEDLQEGDSIVSLGGVYGIVDSVIIENTTQTMYDLTVDEVHTFAVGDGDWVVHNCGTYRDDILPVVNAHQRNRLPNGQRRPIANRRAWQFTDEISYEVYQGRLAGYAQTIDDNGRIIAIQPDGSRVRNHAFAGRNFGFDDVNNPGMSALYPNGVDFDLQGFPIFDPYVVKTQPIPNMVGGEIDMNAAERIAFPNGRPANLQGLELIWHHLQDGTTMQLVPANIHFAVSHSGGESIIGWRP